MLTLSLMRSVLVHLILRLGALGALPPPPPEADVDGLASEKEMSAGWKATFYYEKNTK